MIWREWLTLLPSHGLITPFSGGTENTQLRGQSIALGWPLFISENPISPPSVSGNANPFALSQILRLRLSASQGAKPEIHLPVNFGDLLVTVNSLGGETKAAMRKTRAVTTGKVAADPAMSDTSARRVNRFPAGLSFSRRLAMPFGRAFSH